jgi:hypothetical protein
VKSRYYWERTHKRYGILLPKSIKDALRIDKETGTDFWQKAIELEIMKAIDCSFEFQKVDKMPVGHQQIVCHMIFEHQPEPTKDVTFASVVSRDII